MKITTLDINTFDIPTLKKQHRKLAAFATANGLDNLIAQTNNAIEVLSECLKKDSSYSSPVTHFFWSDREIIDFIEDETRFLVAQRNYLTNKKFTSIAKIIQRTAHTCLQNKERFKALEKTDTLLQKVISLTAILQQASLSSQKVEEETAQKELADTLLKIVGKAPRKKQKPTSKPKPVKAKAIKKDDAGGSNGINAKTAFVGMLFATAIAGGLAATLYPRPELPKLNPNHHFINLTTPLLPTCPVPPYIRTTAYPLNSTCPLDPLLNFQQDETSSGLKTIDPLPTEMISQPPLPLSTLPSSHHFINLTSPLPSTCPANLTPVAAISYQQLSCTSPLNFTSIPTLVRNSQKTAPYGICPETNNSVMEQTNSFSRKMTDSSIVIPAECFLNASSLTRAGDLQRKAFIPTNPFSENLDLGVPTSPNTSKALIALSSTDPSPHTSEQSHAESGGILSTINTVICLVSGILLCSAKKLILRKNKRAAISVSSDDNTDKTPVTTRPSTRFPALQSKPLLDQHAPTEIGLENSPTNNVSPNSYNTPQKKRRSLTFSPNQVFSPEGGEPLSPERFSTPDDQSSKSPPEDFKHLTQSYLEEAYKPHRTEESLEHLIEEKNLSKIVTAIKQYIEAENFQRAYNFYENAWDNNIFISAETVKELAVQFDNGRRMDLAFESCYRALQFPFNTEEDKKNLKELVNQFKESILKSNDVLGLIALGKCNIDNLDSQNYFYKAFAELSSKVHLSQDLISSLQFLGDYFVKSKFEGDLKKAFECYKRTNDSKKLESLGHKLLMLPLLNNYRLAIQCARQIRSRNLAEPLLIKQLALYKIGQEKTKNGDLFDTYNDLYNEVLDILLSIYDMSEEVVTDSNVYTSMIKELNAQLLYNSLKIADVVEEEKDEEQNNILKNLGVISAKLAFNYPSADPSSPEYVELCNLYSQNLVQLDMDKVTAEKQEAFKTAKRKYWKRLKNRSSKKASKISSPQTTERKKIVKENRQNELIQELAKHWANMSLHKSAPKQFEADRREYDKIKAQLELLGLSEEAISDECRQEIAKQRGGISAEAQPVPASITKTSSKPVTSWTQPPPFLSQVKKEEKKNNNYKSPPLSADMRRKLFHSPNPTRNGQ